MLFACFACLIDAQSHCSGVFSEEITEGWSSWVVASTATNAIMRTILLQTPIMELSAKAAKAPAISAEEFTQVLQIVVQAGRASITIIKSARRWTCRAARKACRCRAWAA
jgi:hypothetical protein